MRVLYLTPGCFDKGGVSRYARYQIRALEELVGPGAVHVLSLLGPGDDAFEEPIRVAWHGSGTGARSKSAMLARASALTARLRPAVIWAGHIGFAALAQLLAQACGATAIVNVYGREAWSDLRRSAEWGLRRADLVIADCHFTADYLLRTTLRTAVPRVIWDCVDLDKFRPGAASAAVLGRYRLAFTDDAIVLLTLGRMSKGTEHKGYHRLYEVFKAAAAIVPQLCLVFAGRGEIADELCERSRKERIAERTFFTGVIHEADLPDIYRAGSIFSLVSDRGHWRGEGLPLTALEATATGIPTLVGDQDGSQEAVIHGVTGFVLDPLDLEEHVRLIVDLASRPEMRREMGCAARARAVAEFGYETFRAHHRMLLSRCLGLAEPWSSPLRSNAYEGGTQRGSLGSER